VNRIEFSDTHKKLADRWRECLKDYWIESLWEFCRELPVKAFEDWVRHELEFGRQLPLVGEFKKFWWENRRKYESEVQGEEEKKTGCDDCNGMGFIWATKDGYEFAFRCHCTPSHAYMPLWWAEKYERLGYSRTDNSKKASEIG
jgi:hypothetical protein